MQILQTIYRRNLVASGRSLAVILPSGWTGSTASMGNTHGKHRASIDSYRTDNQDSNIGDDKCFPTQVREFPRVHGGGSVNSINCIKETSLCISGGSEGVRL